MRILKNPNPVEEIKKTCPECECEFAFTDGDIKTYSYSNNILGPGFYGYSKRYVLCPNCGKKIIIEEKSSSQTQEPDVINLEPLEDLIKRTNFEDDND
jgi:DNA-directed RNA polymerase subunit RPC12/RpoP